MFGPLGGFKTPQPNTKACTSPIIIWAYITEETQPVISNLGLNFARHSDNNFALYIIFILIVTFHMFDA